MPDKRIELVKRLHARTLEGEVDWEPTSEEGVYQAAFPGYAIRVSSKFNPEYDSLDFTLSIFNGDGVLIEEIADDLLFNLDREAGTYKLMEEMYETARRVAMGVEKALDDLLAELDDNLPF